MRRKGELSSAGVDHGWPHQVALPARFSVRGNGYQEIHDFCKDLTLCTRGHAVFHDREWFNVYCFEKPEDADQFMQRLGGERFDPKQGGKGRNWARWNKP
jgi:hypothetical protein